MLNVLALRPLVRPGSFGEIAIGSEKLATSKAERRFLDFCVDGRSLFELLGVGDSDLVGALGWLPQEAEAALVRQFLLEDPAPIADGHQTLYVCPQCADLGCGAITARIARDPDGAIRWSEFRYENNYDAAMTDSESYSVVGPFRFDAAAYRRALLQHS